MSITIIRLFLSIEMVNEMLYMEILSAAEETPIYVLVSIGGRTGVTVSTSTTSTTLRLKHN